MTPIQQLLARPDAEQAAKTYRARLVRLRDGLKELVPDARWDDREPTKVSETACQDPFGRIDGTSTRSYATGGGKIPDADWDRALLLARRILEPEGYSRVKVIVDRPGQHDVVFTDSYGTTLDLGTGISTTIDVTTGCFLSPEAHAAARKTQ